MKPTILIAGGSGLIGTRLIELLAEDYQFHVLSRSQKSDHNKAKYFQWDTATREVDPAALQGVSIVINLAGAGIADKRWTSARKEEILASRLDSVATLEKAVAGMSVKPALYLGASAIGFYGSNGDKIMKETDSAGTGFLAEVTQQWEKSQEVMKPYFKRISLLRIGIVLSTKGGALKEILKPAKSAVYGYFGNGSAYYSWIHIDELCSMIKAIISNEHYSGTYNATAPKPITIKALALAVKKAKAKWGLVLPVPELLLRLILGNMSQMLTDSMRVVPSRFTAEGYTFLYNEPVAAIKDLLDRAI